MVKRLPLLIHLALPLWWWAHVGPLALGRRTGDLVSHVWAIWNGTLGDPTRSALLAWPHGLDLLPVYGGWGHTFVGVAVARLFGTSPEVAYSAALVLYLVLAGIGGHALARALGADALGGPTGGLLLQLDGLMLYHATDGRPEYAGVGVTALALALALRAWREPGTGRAVACGVLGAAVMVVSWEHGLWLALAMVLLAPFLWWTGRPPGAWRRWAIAAGSATLAALPWVGAFLSRSMAVRDPDEGLHTMAWAVDQAMPVFGIVAAGTPHPARVATATLLLLPFTARREDRRLWIGVALGLLVSLALAAGPSPGLWRVGDLDPQRTMWGPFRLLQQVPVLGWFHSPARVAVDWSFAAAVAGGLAVTRLGQGGRPRRAAAVLLGAARVAAAGQETRRAGSWPGEGFAARRFEAGFLVGALPGGGAMLELPPHLGDIWSEEARIWQMLQHWPTPATGFLPHVAMDRSPEIFARAPLFHWASGMSGRLDTPPPEMSREEVAALRAEGLRFVAVYLRRYNPAQRQALEAALTAALGLPIARERPRWACWELAE